MLQLCIILGRPHVYLYVCDFSCYVTFHASKAATELVKSKAKFEHFGARYNVHIQNIRADNGIYLAHLFKEACLKQQQDLTYCTVGVHWQNGVAECFIGTITHRARAILLHAMAKWPSVLRTCGHLH
jgi:hypothetical protein